MHVAAFKEPELEQNMINGGNYRVTEVANVCFTVIGLL